MTLQDELRRMADLVDFRLYRATLRLAASKIDSLEAEITRLKGRVNELAELVSGCGLTAEIADADGINTEPEA